MPEPEEILEIPAQEIDEEIPAEPEAPAEIINQIAITNSSEVPWFLYCENILIKKIEAGDCFGYMVQQDKDLIISLTEK